MNFDAVVIGGSYAGLSAAMQIARAGRKVCVVDGGEPRNRFAEASHGFFGQDGMAPMATIAEARAKVERYASVTMERALVTRATVEGEGFVLALSTGTSMRATKVVLAFGVTDMLPEIPGVVERWGRTVLHCPYCHGIEFQGQPLGVLQMHPMSAHQSLLISDWGPTTLFLHGGTLPDAETTRKLERRGVVLVAGRVAQLENAAAGRVGVRLEDGRVVEVAALYVAPGQRFGNDLAEQLGCALEEGPVGPLITTDASKMTTVRGVYAAGDIARAMQNATFASSDGVLAGSALHQSLVFEPLSR